ncbi:hypothetical protein HDG34_003355 [Paraburkholderia sp. HC6.4b]|uniref:hypothetical protein n=1 Tax=unclassified Paraburkholderia TaxID=2615204 RepID=UPI00160D6576|nr:MULTISPECIES: hypothetical protein [unclassified Paraburkholderia]MBB5409414.1 hypothetical protein [Paraburkholderia sp. HC6.4b]MBB5451143.1 hypothetical protein [Paraburkholderia sp. Kb1A]
MQINTAESAVSNLLALIVASNPRFSVLTEDALTVESVTALETPDADGNDTVTVVSGQGFSHTQPFSYRRLALAPGVPAFPPAILVTDGDEEADVLAAIGAALGLIASELVLVDESGTLEGASEVTIDASVSSLLYSSSPITVALDWEPAHINSLVDNNSIGEFHAPYVGEDA